MATRTRWRPFEGLRSAKRSWPRRTGRLPLLVSEPPISHPGGVGCHAARCARPRRSPSSSATTGAPSARVAARAGSRTAASSTPSSGPRNPYAQPHRHRLTTLGEGSRHGDPRPTWGAWPQRRPAPATPTGGQQGSPRQGRPLNRLRFPDRPAVAGAAALAAALATAATVTTVTVVAAAAAAAVVEVGAPAAARAGPKPAATSRRSSRSKNPHPSPRPGTRQLETGTPAAPELHAHIAPPAGGF
jgi:hypothetical protein